MVNELRVRQNSIGGLIDTADLTSSATTMNSAGLAAIANAVGSTQHMAIVLDPDGVDGEPEIVYITALTVGASTATILRGQEGSTARAHLIDTPWVHGPTTKDFLGDTAWTAATLTSPWTVYTGSGYPTSIGYRKMGNGLVLVRGHITSGTAVGTIFTLPAGYRPPSNEAFACPAWNGTAWGSAQYAVNVQTNGVVEILGPTPSSGHVIGLDGIRLLAEA